MTARWHRGWLLVSAVGVWGALTYLLHRRRRARGPLVYWIQPRQLMHPVGIRHGSSDAAVFEQVFVEQEYSCLYSLPHPGLVIDCGANVGLSAVCFLARYPDCHVVAVEPDPANFAMLERNLSVYGSRVTLVRAGVWSHPAPLVLSKGAYRDGQDWSRQVRQPEPGEGADVEGVDIGTLLAASGYERISLLKVDVEGAEAVIFRGQCRWLGEVDAIAIELHDDSVFGNSSEAFFSSIAGQGFEVSRSGELTICVRSPP